jgi:hypothetical protein
LVVGGYPAKEDILTKPETNPKGIYLNEEKMS